MARTRSIKGIIIEKLVYYIFAKFTLPIFTLLGVSTIGIMIAYILTDNHILHVAPMFTGYAAVIYIIIAAVIQRRKKDG